MCSLDVLLVHRFREKERFPQAGGLMSGRAKRGIWVQGTLTPRPGLILLPWVITIHQQHPEHPVSPVGGTYHMGTLGSVDRTQPSSSLSPPSGCSPPSAVTRMVASSAVRPGGLWLVYTSSKSLQRKPAKSGVPAPSLKVAVNGQL